MKLLIVYASTYGQTEKIARRIGDVAEQEGAHVALALAGAKTPLPEGFDAVILAGSVKYGRHQRSLTRYVRRHAPQLVPADTIFVSVSGAASSAEGRPVAAEYVAKFAEKTGWRPGQVALVAGGMAFSKFGWLTRRLMIAADRKEGRDRDPSRDYDYTDWPAVDALAREIVRARITGGRPARQAR
jgi:menaquinone-dependent protoporphyrinogen oxidase